MDRLSLLPSNEKTSLICCFTMSRVSRYGGTAVAVTAIVATATAPLGPAWNCDSALTANRRPASSDLSDRMEDKIQLLLVQPNVLGGGRTSVYPEQGAESHIGVAKGTKKMG